MAAARLDNVATKFEKMAEASLGEEEEAMADARVDEKEWETDASASYDDEDDSEHSEDIEEGEDEFMDTYSDALNKELKATTLDKTFVRAEEQSSKKNDKEGGTLMHYVVFTTSTQMINILLLYSVDLIFKTMHDIGVLCSCPQ